MKKLKYTLFIIAIHLFLFQGNVNAQNTNYTVQHDTCLNKKFSIVFYLVQDSLNSLPNNINTYSLSSIISTLNAVFSRICVSFENCKTIIIPNNEYNKWKVTITDSVVISNWYYPNTINIYIFSPPPPPDDPFVSPDPASKTAYGSLSYTGTVRPRDAIVLHKNSYGIDLLHTIGHYFGLEHTYAEISAPVPTNTYNNGQSIELANGSNSQTTGDGISDTDADPYPNGLETSPPQSNPPYPQPCGYYYRKGIKDAAGNYYIPPVDNIMSNYLHVLYGDICRCRFTQEQYNRMAYFILTKRMYLH